MTAQHKTTLNRLKLTNKWNQVFRSFSKTNLVKAKHISKEIMCGGGGEGSDVCKHLGNVDLNLSPNCSKNAIEVYSSLSACH